jgi:hypothetical protein
MKKRRLSVGKPFIIGENNPLSRDPQCALAPYPKSCTGWRLCTLILRMDPDAYEEQFERRNLLSQDRWSIPAAREAARQLIKEAGSAPMILLGAKVCAAFGVDYEPFTVRLRTAILPHPSGLCRAWGVKGSFDRARETVNALLSSATQADGRSA